MAGGFSKWKSKWPGDFQNGNPNGRGIFKMEIQTGGGFSKWKSKWPGDFQNGNPRINKGSIQDQFRINSGSIQKLFNKSDQLKNQ